MAPGIHLLLYPILFSFLQTVASESEITLFVTHIIAKYFEGCDIVIAGESTDIEIEMDSFPSNPVITIPATGWKVNQTLPTHNLSQKRKECVLVLVQLNNSSYVDVLLSQASVVASVERDFHLFLSINSSYLEEFLQKPTRIKFQLGMTYENSQAVLKSYSPQRDAFQTTKLEGNASLPEGTPALIFPDYIHLDSFRGKPLRITVPILAKWFAELKPSEDGWALRRGINTGVLPHLMHRFNFTGIYFPSTGGGGTGSKENGTWGGAVGDIFYGRAELTTPIGCTLQRSEAVRYTRTFNYARLTFVVANPKQVYTWHTIYYPLAGNIWVLMFLALNLIAGLLWIASRVAAGKLGFPEICEYLFATAIEQSADMEFLRKTKATAQTTLLNVTIWLIFTLVMSTAYKSKLMNSLLFPLLEKIPHNFDELADSDYTLVLQYIRGLGLDRLKASNNPTHHKIVERLLLEANDVKCFEYVMKTRASCIAWYDVVDYISNQNFTDRTGQVPFVRAADAIFFIPGGLGMQKGSLFAHNFDKVILRALDMGLFVKWFDMDVTFIRAERMKWIRASNKEVERAVEDSAGLGLKNLTAAFLFLGVGLILGCLIFCAEVARHFHRKKNVFQMIAAPQNLNLNSFRFQRNGPPTEALPYPN